MLSSLQKHLHKNNRYLFLLIAGAIWFGLYQTLIPLSESLVAALPVDRNSHLGGALQFFFYDTPKVLMLLTGIVFIMGMINSYFTPERTRALLANRSHGVANVIAATARHRGRLFVPVRLSRCLLVSCRQACRSVLLFPF